MATITTLPGIVQKFDVVTLEELTALTEKLNRLETVVAQNAEALADIPLDGEDMVYWLTKFTEQENLLYRLEPADFPLFFDRRTISVDPATGRSVAQGRALFNGTPTDGVEITLSDSPRLARPLATTTTSGGGFYSFDFMTLPNTTYYVSGNHAGVFYQVAIAYQGSSS